MALFVLIEKHIHAKVHKLHKQQELKANSQAFSGVGLLHKTAEMVLGEGLLRHGCKSCARRSGEIEQGFCLLSGGSGPWTPLGSP